MDFAHQMIHCLLIFNHQNEPLLTIYDEYIESLVISPHRSKYTDGGDTLSVENIIMQIFTPLLASQSALFDTINTRFHSIELFNKKTLIMHKTNNCYIVILLSEECLFRRQESIIKKKLDLIEWLISSFYGICWSRMMEFSNSWLKTILKEMWLMDGREFNLSFWCIERIDLSPNLKLTERVLEVLIGNSKYFRQVNERKMKHQLILVGSKLFCLYTSDPAQSLLPKNTLLFVLICNAVFNRFSRNREEAHEEISKVSKPYSSTLMKISSFSSFDDKIFSDSNRGIDHLPELQYKEQIKPKSTISSNGSTVGDLDPFIILIDNKEGHKYRIIKIFLNYRTGFLTPCHLHLIKLTRNVVYIGVEDNLENNIIVATLDKSIRLTRNIILDNDKRKDVTSVLRSRISQSVDKLTNLKVTHWQQLLKTFRLCTSKDCKNVDFLERVLKELLRIFEFIYCQYYLSFPIKINEKLCKCFLRCFLGVKKEMSDFLAILSVKALRNLPPTSFYPLYPGLVHFVFIIRKSDKSLISPVIDPETLNEGNVGKLHLLVDLCRNIGMQFDNSALWRQVEVSDKDFRCTYHRRRCRVSEDRFNEVELTLFHLSSVSASLVKIQLHMLLEQLLLDSNGTDNSLRNLTR